MKKLLLTIVFVVLYGGVTFFGLGPVLLADGTAGERVLTFLFVILLYVAITAVLLWIVRRRKS